MGKFIEMFQLEAILFRNLLELCFNGNNDRNRFCFACIGVDTNIQYNTVSTVD
jgi:hypothetical protein